MIVENNEKQDLKPVEETKDEQKPLIEKEKEEKNNIKHENNELDILGDWLNKGYEEPQQIVSTIAQNKGFISSNPISVILILIPFLIMFYYWFFYSNCGSPLDEDMNVIMIIYGILILFSIIGKILECTNNQSKELISGIMALLECALIIYLIYLIQTAYWKSPEWPNCGYFREMALVWLILIYVFIGGTAILSYLSCCCFKKS